MVGSSEFGEYLAATLQAEVVAYLNLDTVVSPLAARLLCYLPICIFGSVVASTVHYFV